MVADLCCCRATDTDVSLRGRTSQDPTMVTGGISSSSHQPVPHYPQVSTSASLHCTYILLFIFLFHFCSTHLILLVAPGVSECLRSSREWSQDCYVLLVHYGIRQVSSWAWSSPAVLCSTRLVVISGSSLSRPHGVSLVVTSGSLLFLPV